MATITTTQNFVVAQNSGIVLHAAKATEAAIKGIQGMGLMMGFTMESITVSEMNRRIALSIPSGGQYEPSSSAYNFVPGDPTQEELYNASLNSTLIQDARNYVKLGCHFTAPDLISDAGSGFYVGTFSDPRVDSPAGLYQGNIEFSPAGPYCLFVAHVTGTTLSYVTATRTLTDSNSGFVTAGFEVGDTCIIDYSGASNDNDPKFLKIETVDADEIVFTAATGDVADVDFAVDWSGAATTAIHGATPNSVSGYTDSSC